MIMPGVMIGMVASSMGVPWLGAGVTHTKYRGSEESEGVIP